MKSVLLLTRTDTAEKPDGKRSYSAQLGSLIQRVELERSNVLDDQLAARDGLSRRGLLGETLESSIYDNGREEKREEK